VTGRLVNEAGRPIAGAQVTVTQVSSVRGARAAAVAPVTTNADGRFTLTLKGRGGSRAVRFAYAPQRGGAPVTYADVSLKVRAAVKLSVKLKGVVVTYRGRVLSGPVPKGKLVIVQGRVKGKAWQTFASRRTNAKGTFSGRYRLKARNPGRKLQFRARVVSEANFPYLTANSRAVTRTVR
jgi:hypothetical protein